MVEGLGLLRLGPGSWCLDAPVRLAPVATARWRRSASSFVMPSLHLGDDDQLLGAALGAVDVDGERGATASPDRPMALLHGPLDVVRVMVSAADDDQVFEAPRYVELLAVQKAEIAATEKWSIFIVG